jgi:hypothetical protein
MEVEGAGIYPRTIMTGEPEISTSLIAQPNLTNIHLTDTLPPPSRFLKWTFPKRFPY